MPRKMIQGKNVTRQWHDREGEKKEGERKGKRERKRERIFQWQSHEIQTILS